jgi:signal recognition particle receptor subunit beta
MAELNYKERTIKARVVYYGPGMSGKTTNIQILHQHAQPDRRGHLVSVDTAQDRTIMFDLLPLKVAAFHGLNLKVHLVAVPGQPMYAAVRRLALKDVDGLVFVADSAIERQAENLTCLEEMTTNLADLRPELPLVLQYNKRDLPDVAPLAAMESLLNKRKTLTHPAVAIRGEGVAETFAAILTLVVKDLARRYLLTKGGAESDPEWSTEAMREIFGKPSLAAAAPDSGAGAERRTVHLDLNLPADLAAGERQNARTSEALVESYAEAAAALTQDAERLREERDLAQRRLADVLEVLRAAATSPPGGARNPLLAAILDSLVRELDAPHASLLIRAPDGDLRTAVLHGLERDPLSQFAAPRLQDFLKDTVPKWHDANQDLVLGGILKANEPPLGSVISAVLRTGPDASPLGLVLFYHGPFAPPPRWECIKHVGVLAQALALFVNPLATGDTGDDWEASL